MRITPCEIADQHIDVGSHLHDGGSIRSDCSEQIEQAFLEVATVGDHHGRIVEQLAVSQRRFKRVGIGTRWDNCHDGFTAGDVRRDVCPDRGCSDQAVIRRCQRA